MILFLDDKWILYIGVWQSNNKDCPTHPIRKIDTLTHLPPADTHQQSSLL